MRLPLFLSVLPIISALTAPAFAVQPTGIPECDDFLGKYESCGLEILTGGEKRQFETAILESAMSFRVSSTDEKQRAALVQLCKDTLQSLKTNETPFKACMTK
jgi:hypothetical protein